jgi:hypothetical protein
MARVPAGAASPIWCSEVFGRALCCREFGVEEMAKKKGVILMIHDPWRRILGFQGMEKA